MSAFQGHDFASAFDNAFLNQPEPKKRDFLNPTAERLENPFAIAPEAKAKQIGLFEKLEKRGGKLFDLTQQIQSGERTPAAAIQLIGNAGGAITDVIGAGISAVVPDSVEQAVGETVSSGIDAIAGLKNPVTGDTIGKDIEDFKKANPETSENLDALLEFIGAATSGLGGGLATNAGKVGIRTASESAKKAVQAKAPAVNEKQAFLMPKLTDKEVRKATGRFGGGITEPKRNILTKVFGSKDGQINPTDRDKRLLSTAEQEVPDLDFKSPAKARGQVQARTEQLDLEIGESLKGIKASAADRKSVKSLGSKIDEVFEDKLFNEDPITRNVVNEYKAAFAKTKSLKTKEDIRQLRKDIDEKTPANVKNFDRTITDNPKLQIQQDFWKSVRAELNDIIDEGVPDDIVAKRTSQADLITIDGNLETKIGKGSIKGDQAVVSPARSADRILGTKTQQLTR